MIKFCNALVFICSITASHITLTAPCQLEIAKEATRAYYENGEYKRELVAVVEHVQSHFSQPATHSKQLVIIDVDDTALSSYKFFKDHDFGCVWGTWCAFLLEHNLPAIEPIQELYYHFKKLGYNIIFLTSRASRFHEATKRNLVAAGYDGFERLITRASDQEKMHGAHFKEHERIKLVQEGYEIICCIDDLENNLTGKHVGYAVKIPNRLYS